MYWYYSFDCLSFIAKFHGVDYTIAVTWASSSSFVFREKFTANNTYNVFVSIFFYLILMMPYNKFLCFPWSERLSLLWLHKPIVTIFLYDYCFSHIHSPTAYIWQQHYMLKWNSNPSVKQQRKFFQKIFCNKIPGTKTPTNGLRV